MSMISKDLIQEARENFRNAMTEAVKNGDEAAMAAAFDQLSERFVQSAGELAGTQNRDAAVLAGRGTRQLTASEQKYYDALIGAMRSGDPRQELKNLQAVMPETILDAVMEDLGESFPLLNEISFQHTNSVVKMLFNKQGVQTARWGTLTDSIKKELGGAFAEIDLGMFKLSAFIPVSKSLLDLGPAWLDSYLRAVLSEAVASGLDEAIVDGSGKEGPIGMTRSVADDVTVTGGEYPRKTAVPVTEFSPAAYGALLEKISKTPTGRTRAVSHVVMVVNPSDYFTKILPAATIRTPVGAYSTDVFPFPTRIVQSPHVPAGRAVMGLPKRYFMGVGTGPNGVVQYDDSTQFLEDNRVYMAKLYGAGRPMDDCSFLLLDISGLKPAAWQVEVTDWAELPQTPAADQTPVE